MLHNGKNSNKIISTHSTHLKGMLPLTKLLYQQSTEKFAIPWNTLFLWWQKQINLFFSCLCVWPSTSISNCSSQQVKRIHDIWMAIKMSSRFRSFYVSSYCLMKIKWTIWLNITKLFFFYFRVFARSWNWRIEWTEQISLQVHCSSYFFNFKNSQRSKMLA